MKRRIANPVEEEELEEQHDARKDRKQAGSSSKAYRKKS